MTPFGTDLASRDALAVLGMAPTPAAGRQLTHAVIASALRRAGRQVRVQARAATIQTALRGSQLDAPVLVVGAYAQVVTVTVAILHTLNQQLVALEEQLQAALARHPQARSC